MITDQPSQPASIPLELSAGQPRLCFGPRTARRVFIVIWVLLVGFEAGYLWHLGGSLNYLGNPHAEADTLRAAEAYEADGLGAHHGLPRMLYGERFPRDGTVKDHLDGQGRVVEQFRQGFPPEMADRNQWVTTHCPPGADLLNGAMARSFGLDPIWRLRVLPIVVGLAALAFFFRTVAHVWGMERGVLIALSIVVLPMVSLWLPTLHYEGYAFALILVQTSLLLKRLWGAAPYGGWFAGALVLVGFVQGWLSWDHFFVVSLLALPWWILRRAEGKNPPLRWLFWMTVAPAAGFTLAHALHFCMVAADLHSWQAAVGELHRTGAERGGMSGGRSRLGYTTEAIYIYIRWCFRQNSNFMFGPFFALMLILATPVAVFAETKLALKAIKGGRSWQITLAWPGSRSALPALVAALLVSSLWLFVMPQHAVGNSVLTIRHLATFYLCMTVVVARSLGVQSV